MTLIIGLTGGIASGKSTVSSMFSTLGIPVIDADKIAREVVNPGEIAYKKVIDVFGREIVLNDLTLNRKKLGEIIFTDEAKRKQLNDILHPEIRKKMIEQRDAYIRLGEKCVVLDIPLLFESKLTHFVDKIIVVYVNEEVQLHRLRERNNYQVEEARQRIDSQMPVKEKANLAHAVVDNNGTQDETYQQLRSVLYDWKVI